MSATLSTISCNQLNDCINNQEKEQEKGQEKEQEKEKAQNIICKVGAINEENFINGLNNKGYTSQHCLGELVANSIDSNAKNVKFNIYENSILLIDDGFGMDEVALTNMFEIHRENHKNETKMGRSGLGGKAATKILSEDTCVKVFTRMNNCKYLCAVIPWNTIVESGTYIGAVTIRLMTTEETTAFNNDRVYFSNTTGTTIQFNYDPSLHLTILQNFKSTAPTPTPTVKPTIIKSTTPSPSDKEMLPSVKIGDRLAFIFGTFDVNIYYSNVDKPNLDRKMKLYNYFGNDPNKYYNGIKTNTINHYRDEKGQDLFILTSNDENETNYIIKPQGNGYKKHAEICKINKNRLTYIGDFTVQSGMQKLTKYFDIDNPVLPKTASKIVHDYDLEFINRDDDSAETLAKVGLRRNGQLISYFEIPDCKISSARGNVDTMHSTYHVRCVVSYDINSTNNNITDKIIGIQENKNQYQEATLPINFTRLIKHCKQQTANNIWNYFEEVVNASKKQEEAQVVAKDQDAANQDANQAVANKDPKQDNKEDVVVIDNQAVNDYFKIPGSIKNEGEEKPVILKKKDVKPAKPNVKLVIEEDQKDICKQEICEMIKLLTTKFETIDVNNVDNNEEIIRWFNQTKELITKM
jgi:hypothetical protein